MLMTNENVRLYPHDRVLRATVLKLFPAWVTPNQLTMGRFLLTPLVLSAVNATAWSWVLGLFALAALTDVFDGSLARTRKQITMWGTVADPIADKALVGSIALVFVANRIHPLFAGLLVLFEIMIMLGAYARFRRRGTYTSANIFGKVKMGLHSFGVLLLLVDQIFTVPYAIPVAIVVFGIGLVLAVISFVTYSL
ncbi:CDP-alcohol phosphatidyltransferase family protein [Patescibacteria group bacterium]|nr:CDP-alcohol phosphatidyltransferase family protein [Patescibacteria group bacterium]